MNMLDVRTIFGLTLFYFLINRAKCMKPVMMARSSLDWMPSRVNSIYSDTAAWSTKFRPVMDEVQSDEALKYYAFLNYLDGSSFGTGPLDEFVEGFKKLSDHMRDQLDDLVRRRENKDFNAIYGVEGNSLKTVLGSSTVIMRDSRLYFCTGEVKEPIVSNKIICKDRIILPLEGITCNSALMYWHPLLMEEKYCVGAVERFGTVGVLPQGELYCEGTVYNKREYYLACRLFEDQEAPRASLVLYYPDKFRCARFARPGTQYKKK